MSKFDPGKVPIPVLLTAGEIEEIWFQLQRANSEGASEHHRTATQNWKNRADSSRAIVRWLQATESDNPIVPVIGSQCVPIDADVVSGRIEEFDLEGERIGASGADVDVGVDRSEPGGPAS